MALSTAELALPDRVTEKERERERERGNWRENDGGTEGERDKP